MDFYHVLNRGVDKRSIVQDDQDRVRFLHDLYVFNDLNRSINFQQPERQTQDWISDVQSWVSRRPKPRRTLVQIHAFCLMNNHYHLLLSPRVENGIALFMKKLNMGYTKYFNEKYSRTGALWQGKYKKKLIERDAHFLYIPYYIHLNALDYTLPQWRKGGVQNLLKAMQELRAYRWSSHLDYLGEKNFPSITGREVLKQVLGTRARYEKEIERIITDRTLAELGNTIE